MRRASHPRGFTLLEFALVMTLFGLLVGSILRGQELITTAKVRNMLDQRGAVQTALSAFNDRHHLNAGDLTAAQAASISPAMMPSGAGFAGDGVTTLALIGGGNESTTAFQNLTVARYITCAGCLTLTAADPNPLSTPVNSPLNVFGGNLSYGFTPAIAGGVIFWWDPAVATTRFIQTTGSGATTAMLRELDIKGDDGSPGTGNFRLSSVGTNAGFSLANCAPDLVSATTVDQAARANWATTDNTSCAGAWLVH